MTSLTSVALLAAEKFWILDPLYAALGGLLAWFYSVIPSFGVAIVLLTVAVSILRMPLVAKQVKSQQEMQRIQPELKRIQAKYKSEPQKRNEELMKLYKEHGVNPFAGCLPVLLQMPIFIVLYRLIMDLGRPEPKHIPRSSDLFGAIAEAGGQLRSFGMDLAESASSVQGFGRVFPYLVLIALVVGTGLFQARQMTARMPKEGMNTQMVLMSKIFPLFLGFFSWSMPGGVVLYFIVSNMWQIGQQAFLFRHNKPGAVGASAGGSGGKAGPGKGETPARSTPARRGLLGRLAEAATATPADKAGGVRPEARQDGKADARKDAKADTRRPAKTAKPTKPAKPAKPVGRNDGKVSGRSSGGASSRSSANGRSNTRSSGRAQPKGSRSRNSRRGK